MNQEHESSIDSATTEMPGGGLTRRRMFGIATSLAAAGLASACQVSTSSSTNGGSSQPGLKDVKVNFPEPKTPLPTGDVTYRCMVSSGGPAGAYHPVFEAFHKAHPNITIDNPVTTWQTTNEAVALGAKNGTSPDLFSAPNNLPIAVMVKEGWFAPLDDIIPNFETWKKGLPDTAFLPGVHVFNGKTYALTTTSNLSQYPNWLFYNKDLLTKLGVEAPSSSMTWTEFRAKAKEITQKGKGKYYGFCTSGVDMIGTIAMALAERAGLAGGAMNYKTGEYQYAHPIAQAAVELLIAIKSDGSIFPGTLNMDSTKDTAAFGQGHVGMELEGSWNMPSWLGDYPGLDFAVEMPPTGDDKVFHHASFQEGTARPIAAYAKSKYLNVSGMLLSALGSVDGQVAMGLSNFGHYISELPAARQKVDSVAQFPSQVDQFNQLVGKMLVKAPLSEIVNPNVGQVALELKSATPDINNIVQGAMLGKITNIKAALQKLQDDSNRALDQAITAAQKKGVKVSRDDYVFPNWNPEADYTLSDYKQRQGN